MQLVTGQGVEQLVWVGIDVLGDDLLDLDGRIGHGDIDGRTSRVTVDGSRFSEVHRASARSRVSSSSPPPSSSS